MIETTICQGVVPVRVRTGEREKNDRDTVDEVQVRDTYRLKKLVESGFQPKRIMDIGAHIGTFTTLAAHYWPQAWVWAFEPEASSFEVLAMNAPANSTIVRAAVLGLFGYDGIDAHPGNTDEQRWRLEAKGNCMCALHADWIVTQMGRYHLDMIKIDCEQAEVNILRELDRTAILKYVPVVHGEWHFETAKSEVKRILSKSHHVEIVEEGEWNMFYASKI